MAKGESGFNKGGNGKGKYDKNGFIKEDVKTPDVSGLQGSEKQIKYAQDIVDKAFDSLSNRMNILKNPRTINPDLNKKDRKNIIDYQNGRIQDMIDAKKFMQSSIEKYTKASQIIDRKDAFGRVNALVDEFEKRRRAKK